MKLKNLIAELNAVLKDRGDLEVYNALEGRVKQVNVTRMDDDEEDIFVQIRGFDDNE